MSRATIIVKPVPSFRLDLNVWALRLRAENIIDRWDGKTYSRLIVLDERAVELIVINDPLSRNRYGPTIELRTKRKDGSGNARVPNDLVTPTNQ